jgi:hypothetical protein
MLAAFALHAQQLSEWAFGGPDHRLYYRYDARGNRIMDFSSAGYRAGGVKLPSAIVAQRLKPEAGDNTARIQTALDNARGAVVLAAGEYQIAGTLSMTRSGVVLRGEKGAVIRLTGKPHRFVEIHGAGSLREEGPAEPILDRYVPAGASSFRVRGASNFHPGNRVLVLRPVTAEWIHFMGMDAPARHGDEENCVHAGDIIRTDRVVDSVEGDRVTLDVPLSDALDSGFTAASLVRYSFPGRITEVGVEGLRIIAAFDDAPSAEPQSAAIRMDNVEDGWARDLEIHDAPNGIAIGPGAKRLTLTDIRVTHSKAHARSPAASRSATDFSLAGTQILLDRCKVTGEGAWPVVTESDATGPIVVLNFTADHGGVAPREGWATGLLVDGGKFPGGTALRPGIAFSGGSAEGSGIGWSVAWNVSSPFLLVQQPPGGLNWCVGCAGAPVTIGGTPNGIFDAPGKTVVPGGLYLYQLHDRLGPNAWGNIGY